MPLCCRPLARALQRNTQTRRKTDAQSPATFPRGEAERNLDVVVVAAAVELQSQPQSSCSRSRSRNRNPSRNPPHTTANPDASGSRFTTATPVRRKKPSLGFLGARNGLEPPSLQVSNPPSLQRHTHSRTPNSPQLPPTPAHLLRTKPAKPPSPLPSSPKKLPTRS